MVGTETDVGISDLTKVLSETEQTEKEKAVSDEFSAL